MRSTTVTLLLTVTILIPTLTADAQQAGEVCRGCGLVAGARQPSRSLLTSLEDSLRELGYVGGRDITMSYEYINGRLERLTDLAQELITAHPDVLVTGINPSTAAA